MSPASEGFFPKIVDCFQAYMGDNLVSLVFFGSRARGNAHASSDYDLLLVAEQLPESPRQRIRYVRRPLGGRFKEKICIIAKTRQEIDGGFPPLYLDIGIDGIILFDRDFMTDRIHKIRSITTEAGLKQIREDGALRWEWKKRPRMMQPIVIPGLSLERERLRGQRKLPDNTSKLPQRSSTFILKRGKDNESALYDLSRSGTWS